MGGKPGRSRLPGLPVRGTGLWPGGRTGRSVNGSAECADDAGTVSPAVRAIWCAKSRGRVYLANARRIVRAAMFEKTRRAAWGMMKFTSVISNSGYRIARFPV